MERNLIGYAGHPPQVKWPNGAKIAVNFVLNYEEGGEMNVMDGDAQSESYLTDIPGVISLKNQRHLSCESTFEYGSRVGVWRLLQLFDEYAIPITIFAVGLALDRNQPLQRYLAKSPHELAGHGFRWIHYRDMPKMEEKEHIQRTLSIIENSTQKKVKGWYTGRRSVNTRKLIVNAGLLYDSESYSDDLPYWVLVENKPHLIIPYTLDNNDLHFAISPGWSTAKDFYQYLKYSFNCLYREKNPKMMTIGLHPRLSGRPGRCEAVRKFIDYIKKFDHVWICKREEICDLWYQFYSQENI